MRLRQDCGNNPLDSQQLYHIRVLAARHILCSLGFLCIFKLYNNNYVQDIYSYWSKERTYMKKIDDGFHAMLKYLAPEIVLIHGAMPSDVFSDLPSDLHFVHYSDWTTQKRKKVG